MDPRSLHHMLEDVVRYSLSDSPKNSLEVFSNPKRHAMYFPSKASLEEKETVDDDYSTWEFSAPILPSHRSSTNSTCSSSASTPAQELVLRYRSGLPLEHLLSRSISSEEGFESISFASESSYTPIAPQEELKAARRQSCNEGLMETHVEAMEVMRSQGAGEKDRIVCQRPGCRDMVRNVKALAYHIHIHNIHDRAIICSKCGGTYENQRELTMHVCRRPRCRLQSFSSPLTSPIREGFFKVLNKISIHV